LISGKFPDFKENFQARTGKQNIIIFHREAEEFFSPVQTCKKKTLQIEFISLFKKFQNVFSQCSEGSNGKNIHKKPKNIGKRLNKIPRDIVKGILSKKCLILG
jgi:hypothetical protein